MDTTAPSESVLLESVKGMMTTISKSNRPRPVEMFTTGLLWVTIVSLAHRPLKNFNLTTAGLAIGALYSVCNGGAYASNHADEYIIVFDWFDYAKAISFLAGWLALIFAEMLRSRPQVGHVFAQFVWNANVLEAALYGPAFGDWVVGGFLIFLCVMAPGLAVDEEGHLVPRTEGVGICGMGARLPYLPSARTYYRLHYSILGTWYITSPRWTYAAVYFFLSCAIPLAIIETRKLQPVSQPSPEHIALGNEETKKGKTAMSPEAYERRILGIGALIRAGALVWMTLVFFFIDPGMTEYSTRFIFNYPTDDESPAIPVVKRQFIALTLILSSLGACLMNDRRIARMQLQRTSNGVL